MTSRFAQHPTWTLSTSRAKWNKCHVLRPGGTSDVWWSFFGSLYISTLARKISPLNPEVVISNDAILAEKVWKLWLIPPFFCKFKRKLGWNGSSREHPYILFPRVELASWPEHHPLGSSESSEQKALLFSKAYICITLFAGTLDFSLVICRSRMKMNCFSFKFPSLNLLKRLLFPWA